MILDLLGFSELTIKSQILKVNSSDNPENNPKRCSPTKFSNPICPRFNQSLNPPKCYCTIHLNVIKSNFNEVA